VRGLARPSAYWRLTAAIKRPVLLLHGTHDRLVSIASAQQAARKNPDWTFVELEAGHIPMMETPDLVAKEMIKWLDGLRLTP
jgi:pimeloyl-ACP methyl ester carboxylesterase